ncbi:MULTISPECIES: MBL fold metallo-hydrolase [Streptomyces]|uniref:MBL fold metallo-hydrolase n=1 Tax=Streptomyces TaxID=1883 RepID=UPI0015C50224|nr:MBL fold metallo-hydrolase [Streptomyces viridochromogenes]
MSRTSPGQAPGFQRFRLGGLLVTALYDGFVPILAEDLHGEPQSEIRRRLANAYLPEDGDPHTAVIGFLVENDGRRVLVDAGSGSTLGPDTGHLREALCAAGVAAEDIEHVLITHLHPDHSGGLATDDGEPVYPRATVHVARAEAEYWLDEELTAQATGVQKQIHQAAAIALEPYRASGRLDAFDTLDTVPGVRALDQQGHTAGHSGYLFTAGDEPVLFWGDTIHSHTVQLPCPHVSIAIDSDEARAVQARARVLDQVATRGWWVAASHLPFPGLGHLQRAGEGYGWAPVHFKPVDQPG